MPEREVNYCKKKSVQGTKVLVFGKNATCEWFRSIFPKEWIGVSENWFPNWRSRSQLRKSYQMHKPLSHKLIWLPSLQMRLEIAPCYNLVDSELRVFILTHFSLNMDLKDYNVYNFNYELTLTGRSVFLLLITTSSISKHNIQSATELWNTFPFVLLQKCLGCDLQYKNDSNNRKKHANSTAT